jgi:predicted transcriptional regulator
MSGGTPTGHFNMEITMSNPEHLNSVCQVVAAYLARNDIPHQEVPGFIQKVSDTLKRCSTSDMVTNVVSSTFPDAASVLAPPPGVNINETVFPDYIICLEDGRRYQTLKRHLGVLGMSPDDYRRKWGLPTDYPMVCESYSAKRSKLAADSKLGHKVEEKADPIVIKRASSQQKSKTPKSGRRQK